MNGCDHVRARVIAEGLQIRMGGLLERHAAVVVTVNEQHRRAPGRILRGSEFMERNPLMMRS
jgi:hypothetical protein